MNVLPECGRDTIGWKDLSAEIEKVKKYVILDLSLFPDTELSGTETLSGTDDFNAIRSQYVKGIVLPAGIVTLGNYALYGCANLTGVELPAALKTIEYSAFEGCTALESVTIPSTITTFGSSAFDGCSKLKTVTLAPGLTVIGDSAFQGCTALESVTIPEGVTSIQMYAFRDCTELYRVYIPASVTNIETRAFSGCPELNVVIFAEGSNMKSTNESLTTGFHQDAFPEGEDGAGGNNLRTRYIANVTETGTGAGVYLRYQGQSDWMTYPFFDPN